MIEIAGKKYPTLSDLLKVPKEVRNKRNYLGSPAIFLVTDPIVKNATLSDKKFTEAIVSDQNSRVKVKIWDEIVQSELLFAHYDYSKEYKSFSLTPISIVEIDSRPDLYEALVKHFETKKYEECLKFMIESVRSEYLKKLLDTIFGDEKIHYLFINATAASNNHHVGKGGLLFHTVSVAKVSLNLISSYPQLNRDLVLTGALIHDIGKIETYTYEPEFEYTDAGKLENHIVIGLKILTRAIDKIPDFPSKFEMILTHIIVSHHGSLEYGSPVIPKTPEAMIVHFADEIDAKMRSAFDILDEIDDGWTDRNQFLGTDLFKWR
jgi:3'-5' exoribonuclease|uniref:HD domain-containing protein n=1 Tax=Mesoaciditoga lauensis TaxID=1495039 RepID=A0A7V3VTI2_9BACT